MDSNKAGPLVVADTGPLHYLVLIGQIDVLTRLLGRINIPSVVRDELAHPEAPRPVREWIGNPPVWLNVVTVRDLLDARDKALDKGERAVLALASMLGASVVIMDDRTGVATARQRGFAVTGTLGILDLAATHRLVRLSDCFTRLRATNFRGPESVMNALLAQHAESEST